MFGTSSIKVKPSVTFSAHPDPNKSDWVIAQTNIKIEDKKPVTLDSGTMGGMERFLIKPTTSVAEEEKKLTDRKHLIFVLDVSYSMMSPSLPVVRIPDLESPTQKRGYEIVYLSPSQDILEEKIKPDTFYIKNEKTFFSYAVFPPSDIKPIISTFHSADIGIFRDLNTIDEDDDENYEQQKKINNNLALYSKALMNPSFAPKLLFEYAAQKEHIRASREYPEPLLSDGYLFMWVPEYIKMADIVPQKYTVYLQPLPEIKAFELCVLTSHGKRTDIISFEDFKKNTTRKTTEIFEKLLIKGSNEDENNRLIWGFWQVRTWSEHLLSVHESSLLVMQKALMQWVEKRPPQYRYSLIVFAEKGQLLLRDGDQTDMLKALKEIEHSYGTNMYEGLSLITKEMMTSSSTIFLLTDGASFGPPPVEIIQKLKIALNYSTTFPMVIIGYGKSYSHQSLAALEKCSCYSHEHLGHSGELVEFFDENKPSEYLKRYFPTEIVLTLGGSYVQYRENNILPWQGTYAFPVGDILSKDAKREFTYALKVKVNHQSVTLKGRSALPGPKPEIMNQFLIAESQAIFHDEQDSKENQILQLQKFLPLVDSKNAVFEMLQQILTLYQPLEDNLFDKNENAELIKQASAQLSRATMTGGALMNKSLKRTKNYDPKERIIILSEIPYLVINSRFDFADQKQKNNLVCVPPGLKSRNAITIPFTFIDKLKEQVEFATFFNTLKDQFEIKPDATLFTMLCREIDTFSTSSLDKKPKLDQTPLSLEDYLKNYYPLRASLPQALLMALLIGELVKSHHLLPGKVHFIERMAYNFNKLDFVIYETEKQVFYIDPANGLFFDLKNEKHLYQLIDKHRHTYPGLLEGLVRRYGLKKPAQLEKINHDAYDIFSKVYSGSVPPDLGCAKTHKLMQNPVLLVENEDYGCFEAKVLYAHLNAEQTHPLTDKKLDLKHIEVYPAYTKAKQIWDWMQEKIKFFPESAIADRLRAQFDRTLSQVNLENYFQVKLFYNPYKKQLGLSFPFKEQAAYFVELLSKTSKSQHLPIPGMTISKDKPSIILFETVVKGEQSAYFDFKSYSALLLFLQLLNLKPIKAFIKTKSHKDQSFSLVCHCYLSPEIYTLDALSASAETPKDEQRDLFYQRTKLFFAIDDQDFNLGKYHFYIPGLQEVTVFPKEYSRSLQEEAPKPQATSLATSSFLKEKKQPEKRLEETKKSEQSLVKGLD